MNRPIGVGITARLLCSFAAVAALAAAANLIVEHGEAVIRTRYKDVGIVAPREPAPVAARIAPPVAAPTVVAPPPPPPLPPINAAPLITAIERYKRAVELGGSIESAAATAEIQAAAQGLDSESAALHSLVQSRRDVRATPLRQRTHAYETMGNAYLQLTNARRSALGEYAARADALDARLTKSLNGAWKIFGRVIARQSLMQLHNQLEQIQRSFARLTSANADRSGAVEAVTADETAYAATFNGNRSGFARSEGDEWVRRMQEDFARMVELRQSLSQFDTQALEAVAKLEDARNRLIEAIPKAETMAAAPRKVARPALAPTPPPVIEPAAAPEPAPVAEAAAPPNTALLDTETTTTVPVDHDPERRLVQWITAGVLAVLLAISISTIRSIVVPVRRMREATKKIADGDVDVRIPSGGIKELDTLSAGFNHMAAQLASARDMTRDYQQRLEEKVEQRTRELQHLAEHDPLTHLPNRRHLLVLLNHALDRAGLNRRYLGVFFVDIDNFKNLNDSMGHAFGDQVLVSIAQRLRQTAQAFGFAGRFGGDEFTAVYEDAPSAEAVVEAGRQLVAVFEQPIMVDGREVIVRASVGASVYPDHARRAEDLLSAADAALFRAKSLGRSQLAMFTPELLETATRKFNIEQGIRRAIEKDEFELLFQPEVSLDSMEMVLVEALMRWRQPDGRHAAPGEFLAVTEETGLIVEVGNWVLRKAIESASRWHHGDWPEVRVAINVSPRQLLDSGFVDGVLQLLAEFRLPARCIELELTESVLQSGPAIVEALRLLRSHHIAVALDDFGTGYSSLASLESLPLSRIKLDRSLISNIDTNARSAAVAAALIGLCAGLGLEMTAEGIERPEQFAALAEFRSIHLQGYLIARPLAGDQVLPMKRLIPQLMQDLLLSAPAARAKPKRNAVQTGYAMASDAANG